MPLFAASGVTQGTVLASCPALPSSSGGSYTSCEWRDMAPQGMFNFERARLELISCKFININNLVYDKNCIFVKDGSCLFSSCECIDCVAYAGSIFWVSVGENPASLDIIKCIFTNCRTELYSGGIIYAHACRVNIEESTVQNCYATLNGGFGLFINDPVYPTVSSPCVTIKQTTFLNVHCGALGGSINYYYGDAVIDKCTFSAGSSWEDGGFICMDGVTSLIVTNTVFTGGTSTQNGGAIVNTAGGTTTLQNVEIRSCQATGNGGGICFWTTYHAPVITLRNFTAKDCEAGGTGGFLYADLPAGNVVLDEVTYINCESCMHFHAIASLSWNLLCIVDCGNSPIVAPVAVPPRSDWRRLCPTQSFPFSALIRPLARVRSFPRFGYLVYTLRDIA